MPETVQIKNSCGENLDTVIAGHLDSEQVIVFVNGLGSPKDKGDNVFLAIDKALNDRFITIRFDISGYGDSEGKQEDFCLSKASDDVRAVLDYAAARFASKPINIIAHSFGGYVVSNLNPANANQVIYTSSPRINMADMVDGLKKRIIKGGGELNMDGVSIYPRTTGEVQKIGAVFWRDAAVFNPLQAITDMKLRDRLTIICGLQDDITKVANGDVYRDLNIDYHEIDGTHDYGDPAHRQYLIELIKGVLDY